jgi:hypothetical protein
MPRRLVQNETILAGYPHYNKYILHVRVISMRLWNHCEVREFVQKEAQRATNNMRRDITSIPEQPNLPAQPTEVPPIALWTLPFVPSLVQEAMYERKRDLDGLTTNSSH